jgi:hypothetical protein
MRCGEGVRPRIPDEVWAAEDRVEKVVSRIEPRMWSMPGIGLTGRSRWERSNSAILPAR